MSENLKIASWSVPPEMHEKCKFAAKKLGHSNFSLLLRDLVNKYLDLLVNDNGDIIVILQIPQDLQGEQLRKWLDIKTNAIVQKLQ